MLLTHEIYADPNGSEMRVQESTKVQKGFLHVKILLSLIDTSK